MAVSLRLLASRARRLLRSVGVMRGGRKAKAAALVAVGLVVFLVSRSWNIVCTNYDMRRSVDALCAEYKAGRVLGGLCEDFCSKGSLEPDACHAGHFGKEVVFEARLRGEPVFVKGLTAELTNPLYHPAYQTLADGRRVYPELPDFELMVERYLKDNLGLSLTAGAFDTLLPVEDIWTISADEAPEEKVRLLYAAMDTLWALVQSNEFVFGKMFEHLDVFPSVHGSCGSFYVVEKLRPLSEIGASSSSAETSSSSASFTEWTDRVEAAVRMLDLLDELDTVFEEPLMLCDVKTDHFGVSRYGRVKVIDSDSVSLKSVADRSVGDESECQVHSDCDYFDCRGTCDLIDNKCKGQVANNNLQSVCEKVFLSRSVRLPWVGEPFLPGLLSSSRHTHSALREVLERCANPTGSTQNIRIAADDSVRTALRRALAEILDVAHKIKDK